MIVRIVLMSAALSAWATPGSAQGTRADYQRAAELPRRYADKVFRDHVEPHWLPGGDAFWYRNRLPEGRQEFLIVEAAAGVRWPAFDHAKLAEALAAALGKPVDPQRLPFNEIVPDADLSSVVFSSGGKRRRWKDGVLTEDKTPAAGPARPSAPEKWSPLFGSPRTADSPDRKRRAFVRDNNLFVRTADGGAETALTTDGTVDDAYAVPVWWSPDSRFAVAMKTRRGARREIHFVESSPKDQTQPKLYTMRYDKPGDELSVARPHLFDVAAGKETALDGRLSATPWSIDRVLWSPDSTRFTYLYNQRGHQVLRVIEIEAATGKARAVVDERSPTFLDYAGKLFLHPMPSTGELIWMSERDGWNHLYLYDAGTGAVKNPITRGEWVVRGVDRVDEKARRVWFRAGGIHSGQDPYHVHYCRVNFDGTGLTVLTAGDGTHGVEFSPDGRFLIDTWSRVDAAPVVELRRAEDGKLLTVLETADVTALTAAGRRPPQRFSAKGRDGKTDIWGLIIRPTNFDPARRYPVVEHIYAGPHGSHVPKPFRNLFYEEQIAELGFIVVRIDGMGTSNRSKAFHDVCWRNLADAGFPDRISWMKEAAAKHPEMDLSRVGIYGGSAGGQNALRALLSHGGFYKVAVADCGCHDNRMDKVWWNELWMGHPVGPHYAASSNVTDAHRLTGKLLLIVGELDRNVDPASTMQVVDALVRADKDFDLLVMPGTGHGAAENPYGRRRRMDFLVSHLLKVEPRSQP